MKNKKCDKCNKKATYELKGKVESYSITYNMCGKHLIDFCIFMVKMELERTIEQVAEDINLMSGKKAQA